MKTWKIWKIWKVNNTRREPKTAGNVKIKFATEARPCVHDVSMAHVLNVRNNGHHAAPKALSTTSLLCSRFVCV